MAPLHQPPALQPSHHTRHQRCRHCLRAGPRGTGTEAASSVAPVTAKAKASWAMGKNCQRATKKLDEACKSDILQEALVSFLIQGTKVVGCLLLFFSSGHSGSTGFPWFHTTAAPGEPSRPANMLKNYASKSRKDLKGWFSGWFITSLGFLGHLC